MRHRRLLLIVGCLLVSPLFIVANGCGEAEDANVVKREGEPDYIRVDDDDDDDKQLDRAILKAKDTYQQFIEALDASEPDHSGFAVKKPFGIASGGWEHIWVGDISWDGSKFHGVIDNEPVDTDEVNLGDQVEVTPEELSDWVYFDGNTVVGGFTVRALHYQQSEEDQKAFIKQTGLIVPPVDF